METTSGRSRARIQRRACEAPAAPLPAVPWTPVNVWEFEYPWLEYRRPRRRLLGCLLLIASLTLAALMHRAELRSYWTASLDASPQLQAAWSELEIVWTHCQAFVVQAWALYF